MQLDLGNTRCKWRLVRGEKVLGRGSVDAGDAFLPPLEIQPEAILVASVASAASEQQLALATFERWEIEPWFARSEAETLGLRSSYAEPQRLGVDRWLAMLAAWYPRRARVMVVDAGSALTVDIVAANGQHEGGYIMPGLALMQRALVRDTQRVRFKQAVDGKLAPGHSTAEAVAHGAALAQCGAVRLALDTAMRAGGSAPCVIVSGGDGPALVAQLGLDAEFYEDLVFDGLALVAGAAHTGAHQLE